MTTGTFVHRRILTQTARAAACSALLIAVAAPLTLAQNDDSRPGQAHSKPARGGAAAPASDTIIFRNGNAVDGIILEETETLVRMRVTIAGISTETTYPKSDVLEIRRGARGEAAGAPATGAPKGSAPTDSGPVLAAAASPEDPGALIDQDGKPIPPGAVKVYAVNFEGEFGRGVSKTPIRDWMKDVLRVQPDVLVVRFDHKFVESGGEKIDFVHTGDQGQTYAQLIKAQEIDTLITDRFANDPEFKTKPRLVAWVQRALGGGAFLPFVFPEIYFTSDGYMGGIGGLDQLFKGTGDEVAQRKQQSLRLSWIVGLCQKGGHDPKIVRAMAWSPYILSYRLANGRVEWLEDQMPTGPEWVLVKDDGAIKQDRHDAMEDMVRMKGNDFLTLNANTAEIIGFSNGTADSIDDLLFRMGVSRNFALVKNKSKAIFNDWQNQVTRAEQDIDRLWGKFGDVEVRSPAGFEQRQAARGERKRILQQIKALLDKYIEAIDPTRIKRAPQNWVAQIEIMISQIETEQRLDKR